jgi:hypothetical protein
MIRILCVLMLLIPVTAYPFQNEPTGFRNIAWDAPFAKMAGFRQEGNPEGPVKRYMKMDETFTFEGVTLSDIQYVAFDDKFVEAVLEFDCGEHGNIKKMLKKKYGAATATLKRSTIWSGKVTTVTLGPLATAPAKTPPPTAEPLLCKLTYSSTLYLKKNAPHQKGK